MAMINRGRYTGGGLQVIKARDRMQKIKSKPGLLNYFESSPKDVQAYFEHLPRLVTDFPLDVALAYVFSLVELAHNMALYCGAVKLHRCDADLSRRAIKSYHITRPQFREKYHAIYGKPIPETTVALLLVGEAVRDNVMHGKGATDRK